MPKPLSVDQNKLWKILKEKEIADHLTCLLRNLYAGQEATVRTRHGTTDWFKIGKGVHQVCILSLCLFNLYAEYIIRDARLDKAQAGIKITGENINNLRYADDTTLMAESKEELKSLLMKVKEKSEKAGLKKIQKMKIMASGPITSWQIDGETMETLRDFIFLGSKITADGDCSHEIKRHLLFGRKAMANLDSLLKSRDITDKGPFSQSCGFSSSHVWMWELDHKENWMLKNWCFWLVVLEKTLESPSGCKEIQAVHSKGNQLNTHWKDWCWSWNSSTLATWCEELSRWKRPGCWERLKAGGEGDDRGWDGCMASLTQWTWVWVSSGSLVMDREAWGAAVHGVTKSQTRVSNWTELNRTMKHFRDVSIKYNQQKTVWWANL